MLLTSCVVNLFQQTLQAVAKLTHGMVWQADARRFSESFAYVGLVSAKYTCSTYNIKEWNV